jgi:hypothetical protein
MSIEKVYLPSHIRRGRLATTPVWYVTLPSGERKQFYRLRDAKAFEAAQKNSASRESESHG